MRSRIIVMTFAAVIAACGLSVVGVDGTPSPDARTDAATAPNLVDATSPPAPDAADSPDAFRAPDASDGGAPTALITLATTDTIRAVTVDGPFVYYYVTPANRLMRASVADGTNETEVFTGEVRQIAVRGDTVFYTPGIHRRRGATDESFPDFAMVTGCLDIDKAGKSVYVADFGGNRIIEAPFATGTTATVLFDVGDGVTTPWGVGVTATELFFTKSGGFPGELRKRPLLVGSTADHVTLSSEQENPNCLVFDEQGRVYWPNNTTGTLRRSDPDGSNQVTLATGQGKGDGQSFTQLGIDATYLYWSADNRVLRLAR